MNENNIDGTVNGRIKHAYSIHKKMQKKQKDSVHDIYDVFAMRVLVPTVTDCYTMLGLIHEEYTPLAGRFKDYIAVPKPNGYRSLHTTVVGLSQFADKAFPVEVQIRTFDMNEEAEFGMAAHWHYKEKGGKSDFSAPINETADEDEEPIFDRTYAITPRGDIKVLPHNATPIDFAFSVHTDVGMRLRLAKANGKLIPLDYKIQNGDVIEIVTHKDAKPNQNWLSMCVSNRTKQKIKSYLQQRDATSLVREGRETLNKSLRQFGMEDLDQNLTLLRDYGAKHKTKKEREDLLLRMGNGSLNPAAIARSIAEKHHAPLLHKKAETSKKTTTTQDPEKVGVIVGGNADIPVRRASCCKPAPGNKIIGFVTRGAYVTIHRRDCKTLEKLDGRRFIDAHYETDSPTINTTYIIFRDSDRIGFLHDILALFRERNININNISFLSGEHVFSPILLSFDSELHSQREDILAEIQKVENVIQVTEREK
jgi:guanosine-3',5'-bis(diphosphate) 3'-pyrophosphohydrolase